MDASTAPLDTRVQLESVLVQKCWKDPEFRKQVVSDPKGMLEKHLGRKLPEQVKIFIHEEDANTLHLSIPPAPANLSELSDEDLEKVAGGTEIILATAAVGTPVMIGMTAFAVSVSGIGSAVVGTKQAGW